MVNLSAGKNLSFTNESTSIRADTTNAFNHPSFGQPNLGLDSGGDGSTDANPFFGSPTEYHFAYGGWTNDAAQCAHIVLTHDSWCQ